jgi:predicted flap endonuclease-1-like 5' DNA nuclease
MTWPERGDEYVWSGQTVIDKEKKMIAEYVQVLAQNPGPVGIPIGVWIFLGIVLLIIVAGLIIGARMAEKDSPSVRDSNLESHTRHIEEVGADQPLQTLQIPQTGGRVEGPLAGAPIASAPVEDYVRNVPPADAENRVVTDTTAADVPPVSNAVPHTEGPAGYDDLTVIAGIGPGAMQVLNGAGIYTFNQLAHMSVADLRALIDRSGIRVADPANWPEQARLAAEGRFDALKRYHE